MPRQPDDAPRAHRLADLVAAQAVAGADVAASWVESARRERVVSRAELADTAALWPGQGVSGRRLGLLTDDPVAFAVLFVSLVSAGATVVPLDPHAPTESLRTLVDTAGPEAVVTTLVHPPEDKLAGLTLVTVRDPRWRPERGERPAFVPAAPSGPAPSGGGCLLFSSGSTGPRKAIRLGEAQLLHVARAVARAYGLGPADRGFNPLPLTHVNGEVVGLLAPLVSGGTVVLDDRFHRTGFWETVDRHEVTWVNAVPSIITILAQDRPEAPGAEPAAVAPARVRFVRSASAPLSPAVLTRFEQRHGIPVVESYGMTEAGSQITANPVAGRRPGTVGLPVDVELKVVGDDGGSAAGGVVGRVAIRGEGVISAYENGVGAERFDAAGWLDTGDLGSLDQDGFLTLAGRDGDVINRGGEKVFPREVEDVLLAHPGVAEAVVVGRAHDVLGQVPVAYIVAAPGPPADLEAQLTARTLGALPRAHRPVDYVLMDEVPVGPTGKPVRRLVADLDHATVAAGASAP